jgi:hypothetical protein
MRIALSLSEPASVGGHALAEQVEGQGGEGPLVTAQSEGLLAGSRVPESQFRGMQAGAPARSETRGFGMEGQSIDRS